MEQDHVEENGVKNGNGPNKVGSSNPKTNGPSGPAFAMKIPGKLPQKSQTKKPRSNKNVGTREGATIGINFNQNLTNGKEQVTKAQRDGRRPQREEKPVKRHTQPTTQKSRSENSSRNSSMSPDQNQTKQNQESPKSGSAVMGVIDIEATTKDLKQLLSLGQPKRIIYSRIQLLNISENPSSKNRPECLEKDFDAVNGRWDPENWHRSLSSPPLSAAEKVRKFSFSESRDRFQDDSTQGGIILGPQRRSFQDGCHVTNSGGARLSKLHVGSPTEPPGLNSRHTRPRLVIRQRSESTNEFESPAQGGARERQIESASALRSDEFDWDRDRDLRRPERFRERDLSDLRPEGRDVNVLRPEARGRDLSDLRPGGRTRELPRDLHELRNGREQRDREGDFKDFRDRDYRDKKYSHQSSRDYGNSGGWYNNNDSRQRRYSNNEPEPEWYTDGPTSQFDTIELGGFEDTPADFSSWGGEIPMDGVGSSKKEKQKEEEDKNEKESESLDDEEKKEEVNVEDEDAGKNQEIKDVKEEPNTGDARESVEGPNLGELDFNALLGLPEFSSVMEQILKENSSMLAGKDEPALEKGPQGGAGAQSASSRFSQWFQREQKEGSRGSTPHEELENLAELAAERGLASPPDDESKQQNPLKNDIMRLLTQNKAGSGNVSPNLRPTLSIEQQELAKKLVMQQMKSGNVVSVAELEANAGARQSPNYGGVDVQNTDAFNRLVSSIREKDKMRKMMQTQQQAAMSQLQMKNQMDGKGPTPPLDMKIQRLLASQGALDSTGARIPSPEEMAAHTQNIFQQALIKKQLEKQKEAYKEKIRQIEQQRREEQLREAIRSADIKMQESKQMNKSLAFMPTSVMRKMQESREGKMQDAPEMFNLQQQQQMMSGEGGTHPDILASATASFSAKLANSTKKAQQNRSNEMLASSQGSGSDLLARIYQSASLPQNKPQRNMGRGDNSPGLRRNASYPDVLLDASKVNRNSAFHQPSRQSLVANSLDLSKTSEPDVARLRNMLTMTGEMPNKMLQKPSGGLKQLPVGGVAADYYNNNLLKAESQKQNFMKLEQQQKQSNEDMTDLKNQQEVALLTQAVLNKFGITEDQLSRLTPQQQQTVVGIVQEQYYHLQIQKQKLKALKDSKIKGEMTNKQELQMKIGMSESRPIQPQPVPQSAPMKLPTGQNSGAKMTQATVPGALPNSNPHMTLSHPMQIRPLVPPPMPQFIPPPMARAHAMIPTAFLPPQPHMAPRGLLPPPPPIANPLGGSYQAAALMQMQMYQQHQQRALLAAALQQQQQHIHQAQAMAAVRHQQNMNNSRGGANSDFTNPLERWFGRDVLSQSQLPAFQQKQPLTLSEIERMNSNQKQE